MPGLRSTPAIAPAVAAPVMPAHRPRGTPADALKETPGRSQVSLTPSGGLTRSGRSGGAQKFAVAARPSRIDGRGAFAQELIPARRKIGEVRGESISVREARRRAKGMARIMIVEVSDRRAVDASHSADPLRYTNHSCRPNAFLRISQGRIEIYALRDIALDEEITLDYGPTHHDGKLRCRCGAPGCIGKL